MSQNTKQTLSADDNKMLRQMNNRSWFLFTGFNMASYQGMGYSKMMLPAIRKFYDEGTEAKKNALTRSMEFINCTYETAPFIAGLNAALEKENAENSEVSPSIVALKASLMGPASAIGDSMFWGVLRTVAAGIAIPLAAAGNVMGPILFLLIYTLGSYLTRSSLLRVGYTAGSSFISSMQKSGLMKNITFCISIVGLIMVGCMAAQFVGVQTVLTFTFASGETMVLADLLDQILLGLVPLGFIFAYLALIRKKVKFIYLTLGGLVVAILGNLIGLF